MAIADRELERLIHRIIDERIGLRVPPGATAPRRGVVAEVLADTRTLMVALDGNGTPVPVRGYPALPVVPRAGDEVVIERNREGYMLTTHILGRDPAEPLPQMSVRTTGNDDTALLIEAFADAAPGTRILFPDDEYLITGPLTNTTDHIRLMGKGGTMNPDHTGRTVIRSVAGPAVTAPMLTWGKPEPGLLADDPDGVIMGGEITGITFRGNNVQAGVRVVKARFLWMHDFTIELNGTYGLWVGGAIKSVLDVWNQTLQCVFERFQIYQQGSADAFFVASQTGGATGGPGVGVAHTNYANAFYVLVADGIGLRIENCDDWRFGPLYNMGVTGTGSPMDLEGGNAAAGTKISAFGLFMGGYQQPGKQIRLHGNGYTWPAYEHLFLGHSEIDHTGALFNADIGAFPSYLTTGGYHNLRDDLRWSSAPIVEEFFGGANTTGQVGSLGWLAGFAGGAGTFNPIGGVASHPGIYRVTTAATNGSIGGFALQGALLPAEEFWLEFVLEISSADSNTTARFGLCDSGNVLTDPPTDGIYIEKVGADTSWFGVCRSGGVQTRTAALLTVAGFTWIRGRIRRLNSTTIGFNFGEAVDHVDDAYLTTNIPTGSLVPFTQIKTLTAATRIMDHDAFTMWVRNLSRV